MATLRFGKICDPSTTYPGDVISVQGPFKAEPYALDGGGPRVSLSIIAGQILALRQPPRERKAPKEREAPPQGVTVAFDDAIPLGAP
jgi:hypothetical protein